jgi:hypothetical protein
MRGSVAEAVSGCKKTVLFSVDRENDAVYINGILLEASEMNDQDTPRVTVQGPDTDAAIKMLEFAFRNAGTSVLRDVELADIAHCFAEYRATSPLVLENARLKLRLEEERKLNTKLSATNGKLSGAVEMVPPVSVNAGSWFYPEGDTSSDECRYSPSEVVENYAEGKRDGETGVCVIERAVSLPDIYAAVRVLTDDERDTLGEDESHVYTLHATLEEAVAALALSKVAAPDPVAEHA